METGAYSFQWNTGAITSAVNALAAGAYTVTVTDINNCSVVSNLNVNTINGPSISLAQVNNVSCNQGLNGSISVNVSGGVAPFSYLWSNGVTLQDLVSLAAGTYTLTVTDINNCQSSFSSLVSEPLAITIQTTTTIANCNQPVGSITAVASGGSGNLSYLWNNGSTNSIISNLPVGNYTLTVSDDNSCTASKIVVVQGTAFPIVSLLNLNNVSCNGGSNGNIDFDVSGGTPFTYNWSNGSSLQDLLNVTANNYTVTFTNSFGCSVTSTFIVTQPVVLSAVITPSDATCNLNNGSASVSGSGGALGYSYLWKHWSSYFDCFKFKFWYLYR